MYTDRNYLRIKLFKQNFVYSDIYNPLIFIWDRMNQVFKEYNNGSL